MKLVTFELEAIEDQALTDYADEVAKMIREVKPKVAAMEADLIRIKAAARELLALKDAEGKTVENETRQQAWKALREALQNL